MSQNQNLDMLLHLPDLDSDKRDMKYPSSRIQGRHKLYSIQESGGKGERNKRVLSFFSFQRPCWPFHRHNFYSTTVIFNALVLDFSWIGMLAVLITKLPFSRWPCSFRIWMTSRKVWSVEVNLS